MLKLEIRTGPKTGKVYQVAKSASIGRSQDNQIYVLDPQVSRYHARVFLEDGLFWVEDTGSYNGTQVNEERISKRLLKDGDLIRLGNTELRVIAEKGAFTASHKLLVTKEYDAGTPLLVKNADQMIMPTLDDQGLEKYLSVVGISGFESTEDLGRSEHNQKVLLQAQRFAVLYDIARTLQQNRTLDEQLKTIMDYLFRIFRQVDSAMVILQDPESQELVPVLARQRKGDLLGDVKMSQTVIREVLESRMAVITADAETDKRFAKSQSVMMMGLHSLMCVPMISRDSVIGLVQVASLGDPGSFSEEDMFLMSVIATLAAVAIENTRLVADLRRTINELELAQEELLVAQRQLIEQERLASVGQLASGIAHEIKNNLGPILLADMIRQRYPEDKTVAEYADLIMESSKRILAVTNEVRAFTSGRGENFNFVPHDLEDLVRSTVRFLRYDKEVKSLPLDVVVQANCTVMVDPDRLKQVLINLIRNAAQAVSPQEGRIELILGCDPEGAYVTVKDNGGGIPEDILQRILEPFFTTKADKGTGLGLHISRMIVEKHRGEIRCESKQGIGTSMTVRLPMHGETI